MRWKRATRSQCVYENTWPGRSEPDAVGGGGSIPNVSARGRRVVSVDPARLPGRVPALLGIRRVEVLRQRVRVDRAVARAGVGQAWETPETRGGWRNRAE